MVPIVPAQICLGTISPLHNKNKVCAEPAQVSLKSFLSRKLLCVSLSGLCHCHGHWCLSHMQGKLSEHIEDLPKAL